ncbi:NfeD family protein [Desulforamulus aquiferis]|uniref:NfeD family protein n=1 Tax=Desulforamulus aquiferis TaxID=1397668 RepID=A0AAW7ZG50_9FIRM|nr:NfeD family protein [Desulforamulus aquiferis]MDO7788233.1 NfeD family protein [Desulforamulus aquiferis]RYD03388.1 hypothetical protein N752_19615 [Desulforamulus aquiferis]
MLFLSEMSAWLAAFAIILGVFALVLEVFFVPGFGVPGVFGVVLLGWGVLLLSVDIFQATQALTVALVVTFVVLVGGVWLAGKINFWNRVKLDNRQDRKEGYVAPSRDLEELLGKVGVAATPMRPAGSALIDGKRIDVVTEGDYIGPGTPVLVIKVEGGRVVVKATDNV